MNLEMDQKMNEESDVKEGIQLYNIDGCGYCAMVRETLKALDIPYEKLMSPGHTTCARK